MDKIRQTDYIRVQDRCKADTRYYSNDVAAYIYPYPGCVYLKKGKCTLTACVRKEVK